MTLTQSLTDSRFFVERMFATEFTFMSQGGTDTSLLMDAFHPQVVIHEPRYLPYAGNWKGISGTADLMRTMNTVWSDLTVSDLEVYGDGESVLLACHLCMVARSGGQTVKQPFAERLRFADGKLIEGTPFYFDTAEILAVLSGDGNWAS